MAEEEAEGGVRCPYCESTDDCPHLLLMVDLTFHDAMGGDLYEAFGARWASIFEEEGYDAGFDERGRFRELLEEVDRAADWDTEEDFEGGPGMSSTYRYFYCSTPERVQSAVEAFLAATQQDVAGPQGLGEAGSGQLAGGCQAGLAIAVAMARVRAQRLSLDDVVELLAGEPGASEVIDQRPAVVIVKFEDGSGVGVHSGGLDLLAPGGRG